MFGNLPPFQALAVKPFEVFGSLAGLYADGADRIASEARDYSRNVLQTNASGLQKMLAVRSVGELVQAQADQARENFNSSVGEMEKIGDILIDLTKETVQSVIRPALQESAREAQERAREAGEAAQWVARNAAAAVRRVA